MAGSPRSRRERAGLWIGRILLLVASTLVSLFLMEGAVRVFLPQPLVVFHDDVWQPDDTGVGHRKRPNLHTTIDTGERDVQLVTDESGYRTWATQPRDPDFDVLAVGDSFLEALAVEYPDTVTARLEASLAAALGAEVRIVNTGVSGYGPPHYLGVVRQELARRRFDLVLVFLYEINDVVSRRTVVRPRRPTLTRSFRLPRSLHQAEIVSALIHPAYTRLREHSQLVMLVKNRALELLERMGLTWVGLRAQVARAYAGAPMWGVTADYCRDIAAAAAARGVPTLFVLIPASYQVDPSARESIARGSGAEIFDVDVDQPDRLLRIALGRRKLAVWSSLPGLRAAQAEGLELYGRVDRHLSPQGHAVVAQGLHPEVLARLLGWEPDRAPLPGRAR